MKKSMTVAVLIGAIVFVLATFALLAADGSPKVPTDIGVRIRDVQLDIARIQTQVLQLQNQYNADQQTLQHDQEELDSLKKEALASGKYKPEEYDVDVEKLEFVAKAKPAEVKK